MTNIVVLPFYPRIPLEMLRKSMEVGVICVCIYIYILAQKKKYNNILGGLPNIDLVSWRDIPPLKPAPRAPRKPNFDGGIDSKVI